MTKTVVVGMARTPIGSFLGGLSSLSAPALGAHAIKSSMARGGVDPKMIDEVIMGQVLQAGVGQAPARQAALGAGLLSSTPCTTVNKVCGSGLKAVMMAHQSITLGEASLVVAGGMESMSNVPYLLTKARTGFRLGDHKAVDALIHDGLWDPYGQAHMGVFGDMCAREHQISRAEQDAYASLSYEKAQQATSQGLFAQEIAPVNIAQKGGEIVVSVDEEPAKYQPSKMATLSPAFSKEGSVTPANASKINDGAAALVMTSEAQARSSGQKILGRVVATATYASDPQWFTTAPIGAIKKVLSVAKMDIADIGLFEINEAFSMVPLIAMKTLGIAPDKINVLGGAVALGHPIGASGARLVVTLLNAMAIKRQTLGCVAVCLGGGEAVALIMEKVGD
jgi:acetyl-CoA C-acetyltransferase